MFDNLHLGTWLLRNLSLAVDYPQQIYSFLLPISEKSALHNAEATRKQGCQSPGWGWGSPDFSSSLPCNISQLSSGHTGHTACAWRKGKEGCTPDMMISHNDAVTSGTSHPPPGTPPNLPTGETRGLGTPTGKPHSTNLVSLVLDAASKVLEQEWREKAKKDLEEWNLRQNEQMERNRVNNRYGWEE